MAAAPAAPAAAAALTPPAPGRSADGVPDSGDENLVTGEYFVRHNVTIGSGTSNTIRVHAEGVAPVHARIEFDQGICWLRDLSLGSDYGTRVVLTR